MSGSVLDFRYFPAQTFRPAGFFAEFDASQANTATPINRALIIGQITSAGNGVANVPVLAYAQDQVNTLCGVNSMLAMQYAAYRRQDAFGECWLLPLADNGSGAAATGSVALTGTATVPGTASCYVGGVLVPVGVNVGDTGAIVGAALALALNSGQYLTGCGAGSVTTTSGTTTVPLTATHKGVAQNDIDLRLNYIGVRAGEVLPAGLTVVLTQFSGGTLNPVLTTALTNLNTMPYDFISLPYTDATSLAAISALLSDQNGRWSAILMIYGHAFACFKGTVGARQSFGAGLNSQHMSMLGFTNSPSPTWLECADWTGAHAAIIRVNPALGVTGQPLALLAPPIADRDSAAVQDVMLHTGLSTFDCSPAGVCRINRSITSYQTNASSQPDDSYLNTNLLFQAMYAARYLKAQLQTQFSGKILVSDGTPIPVGSPATTPSTVFQSAVAIYGYLASQFIVQNPATFARNGYGRAGTKGQVLLFLPIDFSDQVIQISALIQFTQST